jgi:hypothetical protein
MGFTIKAMSGLPGPDPPIACSSFTESVFLLSCPCTTILHEILLMYFWRDTPLQNVLGVDQHADSDGSSDGKYFRNGGGIEKRQFRVVNRHHNLFHIPMQESLMEYVNNAKRHSPIHLKWYQDGRVREVGRPCSPPKAVSLVDIMTSSIAYMCQITASTGVWTVLPGPPQIIREE